MRITTAYRRGWLRRQYQLAVENSITLLAQIESHLATADTIAGGQAIASSSANGHSTSFSAPGMGAPGPDGVVELADEMVTRHGQAVAALATQGIGSPTDLQIRDQILASLYPATSATLQFTHLRRDAA